MFNSQSESPLLDASTPHARAVASLAFGVCLLVGAATLVDQLAGDAHAATVRTLALTWTGAAIAAWVAHLYASAVRAELPRGLRVASYVVATLGGALLLPLTVHLPIALALGVDTETFGDWARLSLVITAPAHLVFATLAAIRAYQLATGRRAISTTRVYVTTLVVSCIPFALLYFIPPLLVGLTGVAIVPLLERMPRFIERQTAAPLPTAIALRG